MSVLILPLLKGSVTDSAVSRTLSKLTQNQSEKVAGYFKWKMEGESMSYLLLNKNMIIEVF